MMILQTGGNLYKMSNETNEKKPYIHRDKVNYKTPPSDTFCIIPWLHLHHWPNGNVYQCCITSNKNIMGNLKDTTMKEIWNGDYMKQLRLDLLAGKKHQSCTKCFEQEDNNIRSFRKNANWTFDHHLHDKAELTNKDGSVDEMQLHYWDMRFSNLCNMKCRMCGGHLSSMWHEDEKKLYSKTAEKQAIVNVKDHSQEDLKKLIDEQIPYVEEVYFAGGEPLIMDEHYYILEKLIEHGRSDVKLRYNTNLLKLRYKKWNTTELWSKFSFVQVMASIDDLHHRAEYVRKGTRFDAIERNIDELLQYQDVVQLNMSPTIQLLTVYNLPEYIDWMLAKGLHHERLHLGNVLTGPDWYHMNTMPDDLKKRVDEKLWNHHSTLTGDVADRIEWFYKSVNSYLWTEPPRHRKKGIHRDFLRLTKRLDEIRGEDFLKTFPELKDHYYRTDLE